MTCIIHKYPMFASDGIIVMPLTAKILSVQCQNDIVTLWAEHERSDVLTRNRRFIAIGTGIEFNPLAMLYIGTVQVGHLIWHIYESGVVQS